MMPRLGLSRLYWRRLLIIDATRGVLRQHGGLW